MRKTAAMATLILISTALWGCTAEYRDIDSAQAQGAVLGECIFIDGIDVSGLSPADAVAAVEAAHTEALRAMHYTVTAGEDILDIPASRLPITFNTRETVMEALSLKPHWPHNNPPRELYTTMSSAEDKLRPALERETASLGYPPTDAVASYDSRNGGGFSYTGHKPGRAIDMPSLTASIGGMISDGVTGTVAAMTHDIQPEYTEDMARLDTALISRFSTSFSGSTYGKANRVFNIEKAAALIDGAVLAPGEEFDMNAALGERNAENGWKTATGIRDGAYVQEYGGGVCQVSTTLYNAALMADLEITERHHHSWPLGYVDIGRDATISTGGPNLKFRNNGPAPITISASTDREAKTVTVSLYGRALPEGIRIELTSSRTATLDDPGYDREVDYTLPPGYSETVRESRRGKTAETYKLYYDSEGSLIKRELVTEDRYRSIKGLIRVAAG